MAQKYKDAVNVRHLVGENPQVPYVHRPGPKQTLARAKIKRRGRRPQFVDSSIVDHVAEFLD